jgi:signal transduction histidine kinase
MSGIKECTVRLEKLINDLLDISIIEAGKTKLRHSLFYISDLLEQVTNTLKPVADAKQIGIEITSSEAHPNAYADRDKITQVITNLIGNAIKFTPNQGNITIKLSAGAQG